MAANKATLDFKPDDEDLMEEDVGVEAEAVPSPKLPSAITVDFGEPSNGQRKTKERGLCEETGPRFARRDFDSLDTIAIGPSQMILCLEKLQQRKESVAFNIVLPFKKKFL
ncbi:hypothetical protein J5N97_017539 [Dioscorea zingiberensis]|uniref:Uncharacterized protein n=1 Tax=Dioscorea zingiberensis TaxID=325984 RepID=A0A9D5HGF8_9LILI|nr:hypothetical protein J5N97_017539 [Dioscorea zingiberensis]